MPFLATCLEHDDWTGDGTTETAVAHLAELHPGETLDRGPVTFGFVSQTAAQGNPTRYRFACRRCATMVDTTTPPDPDHAYCKDCT